MKKTRRTMATAARILGFAVLSGLLLAGMAACGSNDPGYDVPVTDVNLHSPASTEIEVEEELELEWTVSPTNATNNDVTWETSDKDIATVANGVVTGVAEGDVTITVRTKDGNKTSSVNLTVVPKFEGTRPTKIEVEPASKIMKTTDSGITLEITVTPANADETVTWTSSNPAVAEVDEDGKVTALSEGTATITVNATFAHPRGTVFATCEIVVYDGETTGFSDSPVLIWQAYGGDGRNTGVSHHFVELYNTSDAEVNLDDYHLWYSGSHKFFNENMNQDLTGNDKYGAGNIANLEDQDTDTPWRSIDLSGKKIPAKSSFLIRGEEGTASDWWRIDLRTDEEIAANSNKHRGDEGKYVVSKYDMDDPTFWLENRGFKIALIQGDFPLDEIEISNPFSINKDEAKVPGYVDMVGAINSVPEGDRLYGYEGPELDYSNVAGFGSLQYARASSQEAVRRGKGVTYVSNNTYTGLDTDNNYTDFQSMRYTEKHFKAGGSEINNNNGIEDSELESYRPHSTEDGEWNPIIQARATKSDEEIVVGPASEKLMILQIGAATDGNISHSFVELYNNTDAPINLGTYSLQYAEGTRYTPEATEDGPWQKIDLEGTIKPHHSFLILGSKGSTASPALLITDNYGDMNKDFVISNRSFKVVLLSNTTLLTVQNPFDTGSGAKVAGYVDMVGAMNTVGEDKINGYETNAITDLNKQTGQRRTSLTDTDDNKADFARATYAGASAENLELWRPKNLAYGAWEPFGTSEPTDPVDQTQVGEPDALAGKLLVLQAYGGDNANGVSHHFVELYNTTDTAMDLTGYTLQYAAVADAGTGWTVVTLTGSIPAKSSYLILGTKNAVQTQRIKITDDSGDVNKSDMTLSNQGFKVVLIKSDKKLTVPNPFSMTGGKAAGYVDMVGCMNTFAAGPNLGGEGTTALPRNSAQEGIRRLNITDTDVNADDFVSVRYTTKHYKDDGTVENANGIEDSELEGFTPKNTAHGTWNPVITRAEPPEPQDPPEGSEKLMILQIGAATDGNISRSFVELYNNTNAAIDLGTYSVQYAKGTRGSGATPPEPGDSAWEKIDLTGKTIQPQSSLLILGGADLTGTTAMTDPGLEFEDNYGDINIADFYLSNRSCKVVLMSNQTLVTAVNPFDTDNSGTKVDGYVDMVGVMNSPTGNNADLIQAYETNPAPNFSKQVGVRRKNLTDTDDNSVDFETVTYASVTAEVKEIKRPKNSDFGAWNPITGETE